MVFNGRIRLLVGFSMYRVLQITMWTLLLYSAEYKHPCDIVVWFQCLVSDRKRYKDVLSFFLFLFIMQESTKFHHLHLLIQQDRPLIRCHQDAPSRNRMVEMPKCHCNGVGTPKNQIAVLDANIHQLSDCHLDSHSSYFRLFHQ